MLVLSGPARLQAFCSVSSIALGDREPPRIQETLFGALFSKPPAKGGTLLLGFCDG